MNLAQLQDLIVREFAVAAPALAEPASYTPPAPHPPVSVSCTVMFRQPRLDDGGGAAPIVAQSREITLLRSDVASPQRGGLVVRTAFPTEKWRLTDLLDDPDGYSKWSATRERT